MDRRNLLRRTGAIAASGLATRLPAEAIAARADQAASTPDAMPAIALDLLGGDVWAWEKQITGTCPGVPADATIDLLVNGEPVPASRTDDRFGAAVPLSPGRNEVVAVATLADGEQMTSAAATHTVRITPRPTSRITVRVEQGAVVLDGSTSEPSAFDRSPIVAHVWSVRADNPEALVERDTGAQPQATPALAPAALASPVVGGEAGSSTLTVVAPTTDGEYFVSLEVIDGAGRSDTSTAYFAVEDGAARVVDPVSETASWVESAVVYGMIVRNFTSEGFRGVTARLHELEQLGVTALWFAPINRTIQDLFGYEVTNFFDVRPEYGMLEDFRLLVQEAHARGMRVLMDFVPNHTSYRHSYFEDAEANGEASPYYDFFDRDDGGHYTYYFEWSHLPNLNFDNPQVRRLMTEAFTFWVREYGVDGFRADVAWGIKERRPGYWLEWSAELNRIKPDSFLIAEASARDPFYMQNGFDAAYDWTDELGVWAWDEAFAYGFPMSIAMRDALTNDGAGYDPDTLVFRFLNNNDTGLRFVSVYGVNFYRTALAMLMTLPGVPCVYTGDEIGAQFLPYEALGEIDWSDPNDLRPFVERLILLRRSHPGLYSRTWAQIDVEPSVQLFGYLRQGGDDGPIVVVLNFSSDDLEVSIPLPDALADVPLIDLWTDESITGTGDATLTLPIPAWEFRILKAERPA